MDSEALYIIYWLTIFQADHCMYLRRGIGVILPKLLREFHKGQFSVVFCSWYTPMIFPKPFKMIIKLHFSQMTHSLLKLEKGIVTCKVA